MWQEFISKCAEECERIQKFIYLNVLRYVEGVHTFVQNNVYGIFSNAQK